MKHPFVAYCDKLRRQPGGELIWQSLMNSKKRISKKIFMKNADVATLFDPADYSTKSIAKILSEEVDSLTLFLDTTLYYTLKSNPYISFNPQDLKPFSVPH